MKRFLLIVILSNILLGQGITNSFAPELPKLTKYPSNKFVVIDYYSYEESFGEYIEKPLSVIQHAKLFDNKGREKEDWKYSPSMEIDLLSLSKNAVFSIDTAKIRELSDPGSMVLVWVFEYDKNNIQRYSDFKGLDNNTYVSKYNEDGFRTKWDKYNDKGKLIGREKIKFLNKNTLIYDIYNEDGDLKQKTRMTYDNDRIILKQKYNIITKPIKSEAIDAIKDLDPVTYLQYYQEEPDSIISSYTYNWENDLTLTMTEIAETFKGNESSIEIKIYENVFNDKKQISSVKISSKVEKFGDWIVQPLNKIKFSYFDSKAAYDNYVTESYQPKGSLRVVSTPSGMRVSINGRKTDYITPVTIDGLPAKSLFISVENDSLYQVHLALVSSLKTIEQVFTLDKSSRIFGYNAKYDKDYKRKEDINKSSFVDSLTFRAKSNTRFYKYAVERTPDLGEIYKGERIKVFNIVKDDRVLIRRNTGSVHRSKYGYVRYRKIGLSKDIKSEFKEKEFIPYDDPPKPKKRIRPAYPQDAYNAGIEGTVVVQVFIDKEGYVKETFIIKGVPNTGFNEAAIASIKKTRFIPAKRENKPMGAWISIPVNFKLK
tara:strand:- start:173 stop:1966 length:1794 start_codon:yes stop_codon:yes gene_type:complete